MSQLDYYCLNVMAGPQQAEREMIQWFDALWHLHVCACKCNTFIQLNWGVGSFCELFDLLPSVVHFILLQLTLVMYSLRESVGMLVIEVTEGTCLEHLHVILKTLIFVTIWTKSRSHFHTYRWLQMHRNALIITHIGTFIIQIFTGYPNSVLYLSVSIIWMSEQY